ncbi:MAG TPA: ATP12 family protein [Terriglobia bacterium]|nr:ATP12 family protein [Terriglobia bacterium]
MANFPRRFYRQVDIVPAVAGWQIALDGKLLRSPAKGDLVLPTEQLAAALRAEWDAQQEHVKPHTMPLMQLASTAVDRVALNHVKVSVETAGYAGSDLLCYRAESPEELVRRQMEAWQPLLDWGNRRFDTALRATTGIIAIEQSADSLARFTQVVQALDPWQLTAVASLTGSTGSLILALAVLEQHQTAAQAVQAAQLDELFQAERWGDDAEAVQRRRAVAQDIADAARFLQLLV